MIKEGLKSIGSETFAAADPLVSAAASTSKLKLSEMVDFFNGLPRTQDYVLGFSENQGVGFQATIGILIDSFEELKNAWLAGKADYSEYVSNCLSRKDARAKTQLARHTRILNQCLIKREVSPAGMEF